MFFFFWGGLRIGHGWRWLWFVLGFRDLEFQGFRAGTVRLDVETKCRGMVSGWAGHGVGSVEVEFELEERRRVRGLGLRTGLGNFSVWGY